MQSPLVELVHFRELLKYLGTWPVSSPILVHAIRATQALRGDFQTAFHFLSVQDKPILFFILPWSAIRPVLLAPDIFPEVKQVMESNQLLR